MRFYLVAMIFIIFDIEVVFLYPWAVIFRQLRSFGLVEVLVFAAVVFISFLFLVGNGALSWGPSKRLAGGMPSRTSTRPSPASGTPADGRRRADGARRPLPPAPAAPPERGRRPWDSRTSSTTS